MTNSVQSISVSALTDNQPFCAGFVWVRDGKVAVALNPDGVPDHLGAGVLRIGGVGGGKEPNETMLQCALREASEELGTSGVQIVSSPVTYFHNIDTGEITKVRCIDETAPLLLQRKASRHPDRPYKPGLPIGPYVYFGIYAGVADTVRSNPDDDVAGILFVQLEQWEALEKGATLGEMLSAGAELHESALIDRKTKLWLPENESLRIVLKLRKEAVEHEP